MLSLFQLNFMVILWYYPTPHFVPEGISSSLRDLIVLDFNTEVFHLFFFLNKVPKKNIYKLQYISFRLLCFTQDTFLQCQHFFLTPGEELQHGHAVPVVAVVHQVLVALLVRRAGQAGVRQPTALEKKYNIYK